MPRRLIVLVALAAGSVLAALTSGPPSKNRHASEFRPLLLRPTVARTISKPFLPMLIDLYWLRSLNAIGLSDTLEKNRALYEYGDVLTDLDPRFLQPYTFIGLAVPFPTGRDTWANVDLSEKLLRKGLQHFPENPQLHLYLGFNLFSYQHRYRDAAAVFAAAAKLPVTVPFAGFLATRLLATDGSPQEGAALAWEMAENSNDEVTREQFERRARALEIEAVLQHVDRAALAFSNAHGRPATSLEELRTGGFYDGPAQDPSGGDISLQPDGRAKSTTLLHRVQIFTDSHPELDPE